MTKYEILLLLDPGLEDDRQGEIVGRVRALVERDSGSWDLHDAWGRRRLAYEIDHKAEGSYHLLHFTSGPETLAEISRVLRIDDGVMRHLATRRIEGSPARPVAPPPLPRQDGEAMRAAEGAAPASAPAASDDGSMEPDGEVEAVEAAEPAAEPEPEAATVEEEE